MKLRILTESFGKISDNQVSLILHHVEDALKALQSNDQKVLLSSLKDLKEIGLELKAEFNRLEQTEI